MFYKILQRYQCHDKLKRNDNKIQCVIHKIKSKKQPERTF